MVKDARDWEMMYRVIRLHATTLAVTVTALMFLPGLPPYEIEFDAIPLTPNKPFDGPLTKNELLNSGQILPGKVDGSSLGYFRVSGTTRLSILLNQGLF